MYILRIMQGELKIRHGELAYLFAGHSCVAPGAAGTAEQVPTITIFFLGTSAGCVKGEASWMVKALYPN